MENMKIEINEQQPLDEVVRELESKGYRNLAKSSKSDDDVVLVYADNMAFHSMNQIYPIHLKLTTLAELKGM